MPFRFDVALSFPGEHRSRVEKIAGLLSSTLGTERVLYDKWHAAEFARANLDLYLPKLYHEQSRLLVVFLCNEYALKEWCGLEWRAGRDLLKQKQDERLMFLRLDFAEIPGFYSTDGYLDISAMADADVAGEILKRLSMTTLDRSTGLQSTNIDTIVGRLRASTLTDIRDRCGTIRILTMEQPIDLGGVYTDVNVLERRPANVRKTRDELFKEAKLESFDDFGILVERMRRVPGLEALNDHQRIMIYGKPGAGKTTFLKRLAIECSKGAYRANLVPVFVTLKDFAEADGSPELAEYVGRQWGGDGNCGFVLKNGRALILLDGLDEVRDADFIRVRSAIEAFATAYNRCPIALSCRIAAREYAFERFSEVEMADFADAQIRVFAERWFRVQSNAKKAGAFLVKLEGNRGIRELASSPLLLTLLCLVFEERNDFDGTRSELYREGFDILLRKWDAKRGVERDRPYGLSVADMETLLGDIAFERFLASEYFFDQNSLEIQIQSFFTKRNLIKKRDELRADNVLNSIESHLGLLVQRAVRVYSFSHLTFQEYLTALRVAKKRSLLSEIGPQVGDRRWREVWLLLVTMLDADDIITELKTHVDCLVAEEHRIQEYLEWCRCRAATQRGGLQQSALRAFFFALDRERDRDRQRAIDVVLDRVRSIDRAVDMALTTSLDLSLARSMDDHFTNRLNALLVPDRKHDFPLDLDINLTLTLDLAIGLERERKKATGWLPFRRNRTHDLVKALDVAFDRLENAASNADPTLLSRLNGLRWGINESDAPRFSCWVEEIRSVAVQCRDIGREWRFTDTQAKLLQDYYRANVLLIDCLGVARTLTNTTRQEIIDTMLLPMNSHP